MKILVIRIGKIGDMVMCTPALSAIIDNYPKAEITLLTSSEGKALLNSFHKRLKYFILYNRKSIFQTFIKKALQKKISEEDFDLIFCFETKASFYNLFKLSSAKIYGLREYQKVIPYPQKLLNSISKAIVGGISFYPLHLPVEEAALKHVNNYLLGIGITQKTILIGLHPSCSGISNWFKKRKFQYRIWPSENWAGLAKKINKYANDNKINLKIVMNLLPEEYKIGKIIEEKSNGSVQVISSGSSLKQYSAFLKRVNLFITPDTGPMHMAAAVNTPIVALFAYKDPNDCGPFGNPERFRVIRAEDTSSSDINGISSIDVDTVYTVCLEQIQKVLVQTRS